MDEITQPAILGGKKELVPYIDYRRDAGTSWARALTQSQVVDLIDLAGELAVITPLDLNRRITPKQFEQRLRKLDAAEDANSKLVRIVGYTSGLVTLFYVWWSWAWVHNFARECSTGLDEQEARTNAAIRMGLDEQQLADRMARRDVSYMVNLFLTRRAREMQGEVAFRVAQDAVRGDPRSKDIFFRHLTDASGEREQPSVFDPSNLSEHELMAQIAKMKKDVGLIADTAIEAEVEIKP